MPQTSDAVQAIIDKWFPSDEFTCDQMSRCVDVLKAKGWTETAGMFSPPTPSYYGPREDYVLLRYLVEEWDYDYQSVPLIEVK